VRCELAHLSHRRPEFFIRLVSLNVGLVLRSIICLVLVDSTGRFQELTCVANRKPARGQEYENVAHGLHSRREFGLERTFAASDPELRRPR
jgi:hypothetical protein